MSIKNFLGKSSIEVDHIEHVGFKEHDLFIAWKGNADTATSSCFPPTYEPGTLLLAQIDNVTNAHFEFPPDLKSFPTDIDIRDALPCARLDPLPMCFRHARPHPLIQV